MASSFIRVSLTTQHYPTTFATSMHSALASGSSTAMYPVLLLFVAAYDPDFSDVGGQEVFEDG